MSREPITLYPDHPQPLTANKVGAFVRAMQTFEVIRPGFDAQGRPRKGWTQIIHGGIPIYEAKVQTTLDNVIERFDQLWDRTIGADEDLLDRALAAVKRERVEKFRDGQSGESPAPAIVKDGRGYGRRYPT